MKSGGPRCARCVSRRRSGSTDNSTRGSIATSHRSPISSRWSRRKARPPPRRPRSGSPSTRQHLRLVPLLGEPAGAHGRQRDAARQRQHLAATTTSPSLFDTFYDRRNACRLHRQPDRRPHRRTDHERAAVQRRLESRLGRRRSAGSRAAGRSKPPSRSSRCATGPAARRSGASTSARQPVEERDLVPHAHSGRAGAARRDPGVAGGDARRPRGAGRLEEPRDQAVRRSRT